MLKSFCHLRNVAYNTGEPVSFQQGLPVSYLKTAASANQVNSFFYVRCLLLCESILEVKNRGGSEEGALLKIFNKS